MFPFLLLAIAIVIIIVLSIIEREPIIILRVIIATIFGFLILAAVSFTIGSALPADEMVSVKKVEKMEVSAESTHLILDNGERRFFIEGVTLCPDDSSACITVVRRRNSNPVIRFFFWTDREEISTGCNTE